MYTLSHSHKLTTHTLRKQSHTHTQSHTHNDTHAHTEWHSLPQSHKLTTHSMNMESMQQIESYNSIHTWDVEKGKYTSQWFPPASSRLQKTVFHKWQVLRHTQVVCLSNKLPSHWLSINKFNSLSVATVIHATPTAKDNLWTATIEVASGTNLTHMKKWFTLNSHWNILASPSNITSTKFQRRSLHPGIPQRLASQDNMHQDNSKRWNEYKSDTAT